MTTSWQVVDKQKDGVVRVNRETAAEREARREQHYEIVKDVVRITPGQQKTLRRYVVRRSR